MQTGAEHYAAVVHPKFVPGDPVSLFLNEPVSSNMPNRIQVRIERNALPVYVRKQFENQEVHVVFPNYLMHRVAVENGHVASSIGEYRYLLWVALALGAVCLFIGGPIALAGPKVSGRGAGNGGGQDK